MWYKVSGLMNPKDDGYDECEEMFVFAKNEQEASDKAQMAAEKYGNYFKPCHVEWLSTSVVYVASAQMGVII